MASTVGLPTESSTNSTLMELTTRSPYNSALMELTTRSPNTNDSQGLPHNGTGTEEDFSPISISHMMETIYITVGTVGLIGNILVMAVFASAPKLLKKLTNVFIVNQCGIDATVSLFLILMSNLSSAVPYSGTAGVVYCMLWQSRTFLWGFLASSTYNLILLSFERYMAIVHPIMYKMKFTHKKAAVAMVVLWIMGPIWEGAGKVSSTHIVNGLCSLYTNWPNDIARKAYGINVVVVKLFIPLILLSYTYGRIAHTLHVKIKESTANAQLKNSTLEKGRENTIKTLAVVTVCFFLCWTWNQIYFFMFNVGYPPDYTSNFYHFSIVAVFLNSCINPFIYALQYQPFQLAARKLLGRYCKCVAPSNVVHVQSVAASNTGNNGTASSAVPATKPSNGGHM